MLFKRFREQLEEEKIKSLNKRLRAQEEYNKEHQRLNQLKEERIQLQKKVKPRISPETKQKISELLTTTFTEKPKPRPKPKRRRNYSKGKPKQRRQLTYKEPDFKFPFFP